MSEDIKWKINLTGIDKGIFRTMNGNADEMIAIGRIIKAGFPCSRVDVTNAKYDAVVDLGGAKKLLRIQIKGTGTSSLSLTGGGRSGQQIKKGLDAVDRTYKYSDKDCDLIIGIDSNNGECYILPIADISKFGNSVSLNKIEKYKENWEILIKIASDAPNLA